MVMITYSLAMSTMLSSPPLLGWGHFAPEENGMSCAPSWTKPEDAGYNLYLFSLGFFLPMGIIIVSSVSILLTLKNAVELAADDVIQQKIIDKQVKVFKMVFLLILSFVLCWTPYALLSLCGIFGFAERVPVYVTVFPLQLAKSSLAWNPTLLVLKNKMFRMAGKCFLEKHVTLTLPKTSELHSLRIRRSKLMNIQRRLKLNQTDETEI